MNLANKFTFLRVVLIPFFIFFLLPQEFWLPEQANPAFRVVALLIFCVATLTDAIDGMIARKYNLITNFGKFLDPLADKMLVAAAMVGLVALNIFPAWMVILILCREFAITGLRTLAVSQGRVLAADRWGKNKTISQMTTIITALVYVALNDIIQTYAANIGNDIVQPWTSINHWVEEFLRFMMFFVTLITIYSGYNYMHKNWEIVCEDM